jgi:hypothetical protein
MTAQNSIKSIDAAVLQKALNSQTENGYEAGDISNWKIQSDASSLKSNTWYYYLVQTHNGVEVRNALANLNVNNGSARLNNFNFIKDIASKTNSSTPSLSANDAVKKALNYLKINSSTDLKVINKTENTIVFNEIDATLSDVNVKLVYEKTTAGDLKLAWNVNLELKNQPHWWNIRIDAATGAYINKNDWIVSCYFGESKEAHVAHSKNTKTKSFDFFAQDSKANNTAALSIMAPSSYRALPYYVESPNHGDFELIVNPADPIASPNGWHTGTTSQGNNAQAKDASGDSGFFNDTGSVISESSGGAVYDYAYGGPGVAASTYMDAAITNLFYISNSVHDIYYLYGFDEASGNFQTTNYTGQGTGGDRVLLDAQDGSGTNNANFGTPTDGGNPRMQMFLWDQGAYDPNEGPLLEVNNTAIAGIYPALDNNFDAPGHVSPNVSITANLVLISDSGFPFADGCDAITNGAAIDGNIAVIKRGTCSFVSKAVAAQNEGAVAVLILNNVAGNILMGGDGTDGTVTIPTYSLNQADGDILLNQMGMETVNATFYEPTTPPPFVNIDGDFDNGVIAHEFGHGISTRLVGGRFNSSCVQADESMGEGWSDFIGKILLLKNVDNGINLAGTGTFVVGQAPDGQGIRPAPYSGDIANNPMTYETLLADTANATYTIPHGVGAVWAGMLWDMTWDLIAIHGFNPDIYDVNGTEGNIVALKLVVEAFKLTSCNPGFVDGRDAILEADDVLFGNGTAGSGTGANQCAIWGAFARRGLGENANQGSTGSTSDGSFDYTNPAACAADYVMTIGGPTEACDGASLDFDMVFNAQNGWNTSVGFVANGQPGGSTVTFSPTTISDTGLVTMNVSNLAVGNYTITVTPGGDTSKNLVLNLTVNAANPILGDGDTQYSENSGSYTSFNDGATIAIAPGNDLDLNLPTAFAGSLLWTAPNGTTYTTDTVSFTSIVDADTAVEGAWTVVASFDNECSTSSETVNFTVNVDPSLSVNENNFDNLSVYPNPTNGMLNIGSSNNLDNAKVSVFDIAGRALNNSVNAKHNSSNELSLNMSQLASGVYFITIEDRDHKSTKKIIKE